MGNKSGAVILAAGLSSRMGMFKPLLPFGGTTMIETTVARLREGGVENITVVTGFLASEVERALAGCSVRFIHNADFARTQMFDSVKLGIAAAPVEDLFLLPADLPQFSPPLLARLLDTDGQAAHPLCRGKNGHPLLLRRQAVGAVLRHDGQRGLKGALDGLKTVRVETEDEGCLLDADTPEEYRKLLTFRAGSVPTPGECAALFARYQTPDAVRRHCEAVCRVALRLSSGVPGLDLRLLTAAAEIHDAARTRPHHAETLAQTLGEMGYTRLAEIVRVHMNLPAGKSASLTEESLLYLADKLVLEDREVSLQTRFERAEQRFAQSPEALAGVRRRKAMAQRILMQIEAFHQTA